ncbi:L-dopachrome tautomerase-related protein [Salinisphaera sp. SPP-AMP-43]|uniref:L-dopachrome tautomerase-related protein n=1 Tax=Salinisphaera sp. SPP-AMP-43 TaxID=3121288 RepID=UPI003C6DDA66
MQRLFRFPPLWAGLLCAAAMPVLADPPSEAGQASLAHAQSIGPLTPAFLFHDQMPTGVTVTRDGRRFVSYPRWGDHPAFTVAELKNGREAPYPSPAFNAPDLDQPGQHLISVQSVVAPGDGHLWLLDTGTLPGTGYPKSGQLANGPKLVAVELATNQVDRTIVLPDSAALQSTYLNDVRIDTSKGKAGVAYITDSSFTGPGAIIVVDLASGDAWRQLSGASSTQATPGFRPIVEGRYMMQDNGQGQASVPAIPADGIALSPDGTTLYYSPLSSRRLYRVPTTLLRNRDVSEDKLEAAVETVGEKGASDGLLMDDQGRLYATDYEHNAIHIFDTDTGRWSTLAHDPRLLWPDTLSIGPEGDLYVTANQLHRQPQYRSGHDERHKPYVLFRIAAEAEPIPADHHSH